MLAWLRKHCIKYLRSSWIKIILVFAFFVSKIISVRILFFFYVL